MALAARTDEPLAEAQALATGIATAGLSRLVELGGSVLNAQLCVVAMRVSGGALALTAVAGADAADAAFLVAPDGPARRTLAADDPVGNEAIGRFPDAYRCAPAAPSAPAPKIMVRGRGSSEDVAKPRAAGARARAARSVERAASMGVVSPPPRRSPPADTTSVRAQVLDSVRVVALALAVLAPVSARAVTVVAVALRRGSSYG